MGINFKAIDTLARYVEHSVGLETKMGRTFSEIMPEIRHLKYEKAFFVDEEGEIVAKSKPLNDLLCVFPEENLKIVSEKTKKGVNVGMLHNHPYEAPLSSLDVALFHDQRLSTIMATTPSGGFYSLSRLKPLNEINWESALNFKDDVAKVTPLELTFNAKLGLEKKSDFEFAKELKYFNDEQIKRLAKNNEDYKLKYTYKKNKIDKTTLPSCIDDRERDYKKLLLEAGYDNKQADDFIVNLIKTPRRRFLLPLRTN